MSHSYDAVIVGAGPNGLAAAITLARAGQRVLVLEASGTVGGGARSEELTLPGFVHDVCSAVHPLALASPFFQGLPLYRHGLEWIHPPAQLAHPLDNGTAAVVYRSADKTAETLAQDGRLYLRLMKPMLADWSRLENMLLGPPRLPQHPLLLLRFGVMALRPAYSLAKSRFQGKSARALFAGMAAHSMLPLERRPSAAFGLILAITAHAVGWPMPRGGSQKIADALASYLRSLGGEIVTRSAVTSLDALPSARAVLCDLTPRQILRIAGGCLPASFERRLEGYRYGPAAYKVDWALDGPIPWKHSECCQAGTLHLGGDLDEIADSERAPSLGMHAQRPFVLLAQPSLFDSSRSPAGKHTAWAYCHVPNGSRFDMTDRIENQIERFAPGFRRLIIARSVMTPGDLEQHNANLVGGDIAGGAQSLGQLLLRPTARLYRTPRKGLYICSASTPPGGGVHGLCGYFAAQAALHDAT